MFKSLLCGTESMACGKGDKSRLGPHRGQFSLAKKRLSPGVTRPPLFSQSPILGRKTNIKPKQEMLYWFWVGRKRYSHHIAAAKPRASPVPPAVPAGPSSQSCSSLPAATEFLSGDMACATFPPSAALMLVFARNSQS